MMKRLLGTLLVLALVTLGGIYFGTDWLEPVPDFRIYVEEDGVYAISYQMLVEAGLPRKRHDDRIRVVNQGRAVPIRVVSARPGRFGPGDRIELYGERLHGTDTYYHPQSRWNVYQLSWHGEPSPAMHAAADTGAGAEAVVRPLAGVHHAELDQLLIRLAANELPADQEEPELWFWSKLSHLDAAPFTVAFDLEGFDPDAGRPVTLGLRFQSMSRQRGFKKTLPDHQVDLVLNGEPLGMVTWDGKRPFEAVLDDLDPSRFREGENELLLRVPPRTPAGAADPLVDVVMFDWAEVRYPRRPWVELEQQLRVAVDQPATALKLGSDAAALVAYGDGGSRLPLAAVGEVAGGGTAFVLPFQPGEHAYRVVADDALAPPAFIETDTPSRLRAEDNQADYLIIAHHRLLPSAERLAAFHRRRGLAVAAIDVQDVYDEFGGGIVHPRAIRDFVAHAYQRWTAPRPRFVLLVGDASWDTRNPDADDANYANWASRELLQGGDRFVDNQLLGMPTYRESLAADARNLIPTWSFASNEGHSASDNWFVSVDGDDYLPDLAIGRLPVIEPEEVDAIVDKTVRYLTASEVGPWRRRILWITNEEMGFQMRSDSTARHQQQRGYAATKVYPKPSEEDNSAHQSTLVEAFNDGQVLVHFFGHGGRNIWRTGPPDLRKNHDLFTLEHVESLAPTAQLPLVLSMTCYSAPFDHPKADSIGEKFLRTPDRGAVAVFAASWRNSPTASYSRNLLDELTTPGTPIGTAIQRAKQATTNRTLVETYNLLGDPAIPLLVPSYEVTVREGERERTLIAEVGAERFRGRAVVDWLDRTGKVLGSRELTVAERAFEIDLTPSAKVKARYVDSVQVYVYDRRSGKDGMGVYQRAELAAKTGTERGAG